jgi:hypothetical protein
MDSMDGTNIQHWSKIFFKPLYIDVGNALRGWFPAGVCGLAIPTIELYEKIPS